MEAKQPASSIGGWLLVAKLILGCVLFIAQLSHVEFPLELIDCLWRSTKHRLRWLMGRHSLEVSPFKGHFASVRNFF